MLEQLLHFAVNFGQRLCIYDVIRSNKNLTCSAGVVSVYTELTVQICNEIVSAPVMRFISCNRGFVVCENRIVKCRSPPTEKWFQQFKSFFGGNNNVK